MKHLILLSIIFFTACSSEKRMARRCALCPTMTIIKDSISIEYRDTTVYVTQKGDTIVMESPCADL
jgi:hypothetical protein